MAAHKLLQNTISKQKSYALRDQKAEKQNNYMNIISLEYITQGIKNLSTIVLFHGKCYPCYLTFIYSINQGLAASVRGVELDRLKALILKQQLNTHVFRIEYRDALHIALILILLGIII